MLLGLRQAMLACLVWVVTLAVRGEEPKFFRGEKSSRLLR